MKPKLEADETELPTGVAVKRLVRALVRYYVRREITKAIKAIENSTRGAQLFDNEMVYRLDTAYHSLYIARERMRPNTAPDRKNEA